MGSSSDSTRSRRWAAKLQAEVAHAESLIEGLRCVRSSDAAYSVIIVAKGRPSPEDEAAGRAFAGEDGVAVRKALVALGLSGEPFFTTTRPCAEAEHALDLVTERIRLLVHAVEAEMVLAVDATAAHDVARAFGVTDLRPGEPVDLPGLRLVATDDFAAALAHEGSKRVVWRQMQALVR